MMRVSRQWADLVRTGAYFRTICLSLDAAGDHTGGADPRYVLTLGNHHTKRCAAVNDETMRRLIHMARGTLTCLYVEGLQNITTSAFNGLRQAQQLRSLTVRDCPKVGGMHLALWLPHSLRCLRLEGSNMTDDAQQLRALKRRLTFLSHDKLVVALDECPVCHKVCFADEPLVCEGCGLRTCSAGCAGAVYVCDGCDKAFCDGCRLRESCTGCAETFCAACADERLLHGPCSQCDGRSCDDCQASECHMTSCDHCDDCFCGWCVDEAAPEAYTVHCDRCHLECCVACSAITHCETCGEDVCTSCVDAASGACSRCGKTSCGKAGCGELCGGCQQLICAGCFSQTCSRPQCGKRFCADCTDPEVEQAHATHLGAPTSERCEACDNYYCAACQDGALHRCDVCREPFACDTPACEATLRWYGSECLTCGALTCAMCDCQCTARAHEEERERAQENYLPGVEYAA